MLEVANVEHALFAMLSQSYSLRRFPATDPLSGRAGVGHWKIASLIKSNCLWFRNCYRGDYHALE
jgi:hypothetical protein